MTETTPGAGQESSDLDRAVGLYFDEVLRQRESLAQSSVSLDSRATVLVGSVAVGLVLTGTGLESTLASAGQFLGLVALVLGISVLAPRKIDEISVEKIREQVAESDTELVATVLFVGDHLSYAIAANRRRFLQRANRLTLGFVFLGGAILFVLLGAKLGI